MGSQIVGPIHRYCTLGCQEGAYWAVEQLADLFRTTTKVKTQQVARSRGQRCGDIALAADLADSAGPVTTLYWISSSSHERFGSSSNPLLNRHLHYPLRAGIDKPLNEAAAGKIRGYRADYSLV